MESSQSRQWVTAILLALAVALGEVLFVLWVVNCGGHPQRTRRSNPQILTRQQPNTKPIHAHADPRPGVGGGRPSWPPSLSAGPANRDSFLLAHVRARSLYRQIGMTSSLRF